MRTIRPQFRIQYNSRDITRDVSPYLVSCRYTGEEKDAADTIEITFEDTAALWRNNWYPVKGDIVNLEIGYTGLVSCGNFKVDEIALSGPPDQITIRGIATGYSKAFRTKTSFSHEKKTLAQIAGVIASKNALTVQGDIPDIYIKRVTQYRETDLCFLRRLSEKYGCVFSIRDNQMIFTDADALEARSSGISIDRTELVSYSLEDKTSESYSAATVRYHDPGTQKVVKATFRSSDQLAPGNPVPAVPNSAFVDPLTAASYVGADVIEIRNKRVENDGQAKKVAQAALRKNLQKLEGTITLEGNPLLMEGVSFELTGMGALSGRYYIKKPEHAIDAGSGYLTTLSIKRLDTIEKSKWQPKTVVLQGFQERKI